MLWLYSLWFVPQSRLYSFTVLFSLFFFLSSSLQNTGGSWYQLPRGKRPQVFDGWLCVSSNTMVLSRDCHFSPVQTIKPDKERLLSLMFLRVSAEINTIVSLCQIVSTPPDSLLTLNWPFVLKWQVSFISCPSPPVHRCPSFLVKRTWRVWSLRASSRASSTTMQCCTRCLWWGTPTPWWRGLPWGTSLLDQQVRIHGTQGETWTGKETVCGSTGSQPHRTGLLHNVSK